MVNDIVTALEVCHLGITNAVFVDVSIAAFMPAYDFTQHSRPLLGKSRKIGADRLFVALLTSLNAVFVKSNIAIAIYDLSEDWSLWSM